MFPINIATYGAVGDGAHDDTAAIQRSVTAAARHNSAVYIPAGTYRVTRPIHLPATASNIAIHGDAANVTIIEAQDCAGLSFSFLQDGAQQPFGIAMRDITLRARGMCGTALRICYSDPDVTSDHYRSSVTLTRVNVESGNLGSWMNGVEIEAAWNVTMENCYISGDAAGGVWPNMRGVGLNLRRMCVNFHAHNCRFNFWKTGFLCHGENRNTEGLFFVNCSMVAVHRGVWVAGNPGISPARISTFVWLGGMVENRFKGVTGGLAAFHLQHVWTVLINGCQMISETLETLEYSYGVVPQDCHGVVVTGCDINAYSYGVLTTGACRGVAVRSNTFTNTKTHVLFCGGAERCRADGNVCVDGPLVEHDACGFDGAGKPYNRLE